MTTYLLFYRPSGPLTGRAGGEIICLDTRSPFCHVAGRVTDADGDRVYEALLTPGVRVRPYDAAGADRGAVEVAWPLNVAFLEAQVGKRYNLRALLEDAVSGLLPAGLHLIDTEQGGDDCSLYMAEAAGLAVKDYALRGPVTPGQLYLAVTETNNGNQ